MCVNSTSGGFYGKWIGRFSRGYYEVHVLEEAEMNEPRIREITDEEAAEFEKTKNGSIKTSSSEGL